MNHSRRFRLKNLAHSSADRPDVQLLKEASPWALAFRAGGVRLRKAWGPDPMRCRLRQIQSGAFTLIELLVVVAIVLSLMALLLPFVNRLTQKAAESKCMSNLRQFGVAAMLYAGEHDGYMPAARKLPPDQYWKDQLNPYLSDAITSKIQGDAAAKMTCPTYLKAGFYSQNCGSYSWNGYFGFRSAATLRLQRKLTSVTQPSRTALAIDGTGKKGADLNDYFFEECGEPASVNACAALHQNGFNALFVDGHVDRILKSWIDNRPKPDVFWGDPDFGW